MYTSEGPSKTPFEGPLLRHAMRAAISDDREQLDQEQLGGREGGRAGGNTCLGKAKNDILRPHSESNGGQDQSIHAKGQPKHVIGPSPYIYVCIYIRCCLINSRFKKVYRATGGGPS